MKFEYANFKYENMSKFISYCSLHRPSSVITGAQPANFQAGQANVTEQILCGGGGVAIGRNYEFLIDLLIFEVKVGQNGGVGKCCVSPKTLFFMSKSGSRGSDRLPPPPPPPPLATSVPVRKGTQYYKGQFVSMVETPNNT